MKHLEQLLKRTLKEQAHIPDNYLASIKSLTNDCYKVIFGTGYNSDPGGSNEDINNTGNNLYLGATGYQLSIVSGDANDTLLGTGAQVLSLAGLDVNNDEISELVFMDGITPVLTANEYVRLNSVINTNYGGAGHGPVGTVNITGGGFNWCKLEPSQSNGLLGRYSIPRLWTFIGDVISFSGDNSTEYYAQICVKLPTTSLFEAHRQLVYRNTGDIRATPSSTQGPADLVLKSTKLSGAGTEHISCYFSGYLILTSELEKFTEVL